MRLISTLFCVFLMGTGIAGGPSPEEYKQAFSQTSFSACEQLLSPLIQRSFKAGLEGDSSAVPFAIRLLSEKIFAFRIVSSDANYYWEFRRMEYFQGLISEDMRGRVEEGRLMSLASYLRDECAQSLDVFKEEYKIAREKDDALIRSGKIAKPIVFTGVPSTPNQRIVWERRREVLAWNNQVSRHRKYVLRLFKQPIASYMTTLTKDVAIKFATSFSEQARLNDEEKKIIFKDIKP